MEVGQLYQGTPGMVPVCVWGGEGEGGGVSALRAGRRALARLAPHATPRRRAYAPARPRSRPSTRCRGGVGRWLALSWRICGEPQLPRAPTCRARRGSQRQRAHQQRSRKRRPHLVRVVGCHAAGGPAGRWGERTCRVPPHLQQLPWRAPCQPRTAPTRRPQAPPEDQEGVRSGACPAGATAVAPAGMRVRRRRVHTSWPAPHRGAACEAGSAWLNGW